MPEKLRVGIVGCGAIAGLRHIPAYLKLGKRVVLQSVCDTNHELAGDTARRFGIPNFYPGMTEMLAAEQLDIINICTPPQTHAALAVSAIENGCHVVMEKPMALTTTDCDAMMAAAGKHHVRLCVLHNQLFYPPFVLARRLVAEGAIGDFLGMRIFMSDPKDEMIMRETYWIHKLPGGVMGESGPHPVYKSIAFIGNITDVHVQARSHLVHPWAPFDDFSVQLEGERGTSSIVMSYAGNRRASTIDIMGTEGELHLDLLQMLLIRRGKNESMQPVSLAMAALGTAARIVWGVAGNAVRFLSGQTEYYGHSAVISSFVDSVLSGSPPPTTPQEGRETTRVLQLIADKIQELQGVPA